MAETQSVLKITAQYQEDFKNLKTRSQGKKKFRVTEGQLELEPPVHIYVLATLMKIQGFARETGQGYLEWKITLPDLVEVVGEDEIEKLREKATRRAGQAASDEAQITPVGTQPIQLNEDELAAFECLNSQSEFDKRNTKQWYITNPNGILRDFNMDSKMVNHFAFSGLIRLVDQVQDLWWINRSAIITKPTIDITGGIDHNDDDSRTNPTDPNGRSQEMPQGTKRKRRTPEEMLDALRSAATRKDGKLVLTSPFTVLGNQAAVKSMQKQGYLRQHGRGNWELVIESKTGLSSATKKSRKRAKREKAVSLPEQIAGLPRDPQQLKRTLIRTILLNGSRPAKEDLVAFDEVLAEVQGKLRKVIKNYNQVIDLIPDLAELLT